MKPIFKGLPGWRRKCLVSALPKRKELSHATSDQKRDAYRKPEMRQFQLGSRSIFHVTCQLPKQGAFLLGA